MQISGALLVHVDHVSQAAEKIMDLHAPAGDRCQRCQLVWPCDAARLASQTTDLLAEVGALLGEPPQPQPPMVDVTVDTEVVRAWRAARGAADRAYRRVRELIPDAAEGALPQPCPHCLTDEQQAALAELVAAEAEQVRRALSMLEEAGASA